VGFISHGNGNTKKSNQILEAKGKIQCETYADDVNCKDKIQQYHRYSVRNNCGKALCVKMCPD